MKGQFAILVLVVSVLGYYIYGTYVGLEIGKDFLGNHEETKCKLLHGVRGAEV
jgi:hypothetical protein